LARRTGPPSTSTALHARVSKEEEQDPETQLVELRHWAMATGTKAKEYVDELSTRDQRLRHEEILRLARLAGYGTR
jgi:hypothetical protein